MEALNKDSVDLVVCLGDVAATGPQPNQILAKLKSLDIPIVMGNKDELLLNMGPSSKATDENQEMAKINEIDSWCAKQISASNRDFIRTFRQIISIPIDFSNSNSLLCFHGSPRSNTDLITSKTPDDSLDIMLKGHYAHIMTGGHSHIPMLRCFGQISLVNPGSVGQAIRRIPDSSNVRILPCAEYVILSLDESGALSRAEFLRVPIDMSQVLREALKSEMPHAEWWATRWKS